MLDRFAALLESRDRFLLTAHENPDGDAVGALVGLAHYLRGSGKTVRIVVSPDLPDSLRFLDTEGWIEVYGAAHADLASWAETWVLLDASEPQRLGVMLEAFQASKALKVCLDHHLSENPMGFDHAFVDSSASASAELVYSLASSRMTLPLPMAQALYAGMADDTGNFRFSNATPRIHRFAADLIELGVDPSATYQALYHQGRPERLRLFGRAFERMRFLDQGRYASTLVTQADLDACGATKDDMEGLVNKALEIRGVEVSCLMYELADGHYKVGLRSRGQVNVNAVCRQLGGGGHKLASGAKVDGPAKAAQTRVDTLVVSQIASDLSAT
ncbi:MAG: Exopolyphosphatase-like protein [Holophagaceae bacterium]|nr:Exopolyphosphatase-like protein [Holophagaceae bacterium]